MDITKIRWRPLVLGAGALLFAGVIYAWSILKAPLAEAFGWQGPELALNYTIMLLCFCGGNLLSGFLSDKTTPRLRVLISAVLFCAGFVCTSFLDGSSIIPLYIFYGVMTGLGIGFVYTTVVPVTNAWFPDKRGISSGVLMMAFACSTLLLGKVAEALINSPAIGWRMMFRIFGIVLGAVLLITAVFIKEPPANAKFPEIRQKARKAEFAFEQRDYSAKEMLKRGSYWLQFAFFALFSAIGGTVISFAKDFQLVNGVQESLAITMVGMMSVCNGLGRLATGFLYDAKGMRTTQIFLSVMGILAPAVTLLSVLTASAVLCVAGICLCGFCYGILPSLQTPMIETFYGSKHFAMNYGLSMLTLIPNSLTATLASSMITSSGSYLSTCIMLTVFGIAGAIADISLKRP